MLWTFSVEGSTADSLTCIVEGSAQYTLSIRIETRAAEAGLDYCTGGKQVARRAVFCECKRNGNACRVNIQCKFAVPRASAAHYIRSFGDIVKPREIQRKTGFSFD